MPRLTPQHILLVVIGIVMTSGIVFTSCARMGQPDGGWYDQLPPKVLGAIPADGATHVNGKRIVINFDEYIKLENPQQNVIISPAQHEQPNIRVQGKRIVIDLSDSLLPNTTYTIDFSDAIRDLTEGNPLGNYAYTFSTGDVIDSMQISGHVVDAYTLDPVSGILVGAITTTTEADDADSLYVLQRVGRTDTHGHFNIRGIAPGNYRVIALADADGDFKFSQTTEKVGFNDSIYTPSFGRTTRQDTLWHDSLHIRDIQRIQYTRFQPDNIVLRAFTATPDTRALLKVIRSSAERFDVYFSAPDTQLPVVKGLNFDSQDAFVVESSPHNDTITYWLRDSLHIKQDTLNLTLSYRATDTLGIMQPRTDTIDVVSRIGFAQRMKGQARQRKKQETTEDPNVLKVQYNIQTIMSPDNVIPIVSPTPLAHIDTAAIHLYAQKDSTWVKVDKRLIDKGNRNYELRALWQHNTSYSLEIDSAAFTDIYGRSNVAYKTGISIPDESEYGSLIVTIEEWKDKNVIAQLLTQQGGVVKEVAVKDGIAAFFYLRTGGYYLRAFTDDNANGEWDTGDFSKRRQPELMCYYPRPIACRANWDIRERWNPLSLPANKQRAKELRTTDKKEDKRSTASRNQERARKLGITEIPMKVLEKE